MKGTPSLAIPSPGFQFIGGRGSDWGELAGASFSVVRFPWRIFLTAEMRIITQPERTINVARGKMTQKAICGKDMGSLL